MEWIPTLAATASVSSNKTDDSADHIEDPAPANNDSGKGVDTNMFLLPWPSLQNLRILVWPMIVDFSIIFVLSF